MDPFVEVIENMGGSESASWVNRRLRLLLCLALAKACGDGLYYT